jgi:hypothetical protein
MREEVMESIYLPRQRRWNWEWEMKEALGRPFGERRDETSQQREGLCWRLRRWQYWLMSWQWWWKKEVE